jgi:hypothetical protein
MKILRLSAPALAIVLGLALIAPASALGQNNLRQLGIGVHNFVVPATGDQQIRVTVGDPSAGNSIDGSGELVIIVGAGPGGGHVRHRLEPGATYTFTLDPSAAGRLVDPRRGTFHVPVRFEVEAETVDGRPAPRPSVTIEVVEARTGALQTAYVFPGFTGGVRVAAADLE